MNKTFELYNWKFAIKNDLLCFEGSVKGHYKFKDYHRIFTSAFKDIEQKEDFFVAYLNNDDKCTVRYDSHLGRYNDFEVFMNECGFMPDKEKTIFCNRIRSDSDKYQAKKEKNFIDLFPSNCKEGILFIFNERESYYLDTVVVKKKDNNPEVKGYYYVNTGTYQDSILYCFGDDKYGLEDPKFRFFPYQNNRLEFYEMSDEYSEIFIYNDGDHPLEVDTMYGMYLLPPKTISICNNDPSDYKIDQPTVPGIDRYNLHDVYIDNNGVISYGSLSKNPRIIYKENKDQE